MQQRIQEMENPQIPKLWLRVTAAAEKLSSSDILLATPRQYAEQLAIYEHRLYANIQHYEFIGQKWGRNNPNRFTDTPNVIAYTEHYNQVNSWYIYKILHTPTISERASIISKLIHIMLFSYQFNNFLGAFGILFALNSVGIYRLVKTWEQVPVEKRRIVWIFSKFIASAFRLYKSEFNHVSLDCFLIDV